MKYKIILYLALIMGFIGFMLQIWFGLAVGLKLTMTTGIIFIMYGLFCIVKLGISRRE
jgi:hypothetical protein